MDVSKNRGIFLPKMDGENNGSKPYEQMDDLGVPLFLETPKTTHKKRKKLATKKTRPRAQNPNVSFGLVYSQVPAAHLPEISLPVLLQIGGRGFSKGVFFKPWAPLSSSGTS